MKQLVYSFNEGTKEIEEQLGPRGRNLVKLLNLGIPVPFGFTILASASEEMTEEVKRAIYNKISEIEEVTGKGFGSETSPLLVSVRSGLGYSMPGTLEGILNVGATDQSDKGYEKLKKLLKDDFSTDPYEQLEAAITKVQKSWDKPEEFFRNMGKEANGNSIIIQQMVYGDKDDNSFSAIVNTRNSENGNKEIVCDYRIKATFEELLQAKDNLHFDDMEKRFPYEAAKIAKICRILEHYYSNAATIYIVCEAGKLYVLKSDIENMQPFAKVKVANDMVEEGLISKKDAVMRITPDEIDKIIATTGTESLYQDDNIKRLLSWADEFKGLKVRANINGASEAMEALQYGAQGIGLVRTERMFREEKKLEAIQRLILSQNPQKRSDILTEILRFHKRDIKQIFEVMEDRPVTIRLLDLPFCDFLPNKEKDIKKLAAQVHIGYEKLLSTLEQLSEINPMLGNRGCRLNVAFPEIAMMQAEAIALAALEVKREKNVEVFPEILIPMVGNEKELKYVTEKVRNRIEEVADREETTIKYTVGTMIEIPRAALVADKIAQTADFFSIGTNDLTQMVYGFSRADTDAIIKEYVKKGIFDVDPFKSLDLEGVAPLIASAVKGARKVKDNIRIGVCGEHTSDSKSIEFFEEMNLGYISCSPDKVPKARIAAAQASINRRNNSNK